MKASLRKKAGLVICGLVLVSASFGYAKGKAGQPLNITAVCPMYQTQPIRSNGNKALELIEKNTNAQFKVDWVPKPNYTDKLNVMFAANQLPMVTVAETNMVKSSNIYTAIKHGMFWDVTSLIRRYPNLKKLYGNKLVIRNISIDGKLYGLPRLRPLVRTGLVYRKDWLERLKLKPPTNLDELYNVAKAFTLNDPDGNGKNDTIGLDYADISAGSPGWNGIDILVCSLGGFNQWGVQDGKLAPAFSTNKYIQVLSLFRKLYNEKFMNQDFMLAKGSRQYASFKNGKAGMFLGTVDSLTNGSFATLLDIVPDANIALAPSFKGPKGKKINAGPGSNGLVLFSKSSVKRVAELKAILAVFDKMASPQMTNLLNYGLEGESYVMENGLPKIKNRDLINENIGDLINLFVTPPFSEIVQPTALGNRWRLWEKENAKYAVANICEPYTSATQAQLGGELEKQLMDARIKFVMGAIDEAGYKKAVTNWYHNGGTKIIAEYTEQYRKK
jgi:putative aldouronate transport system substrate-binding protein